PEAAQVMGEYVLDRAGHCEPSWRREQFPDRATGMPIAESVTPSSYAAGSRTEGSAEIPATAEIPGRFVGAPPRLHPSHRTNGWPSDAARQFRQRRATDGDASSEWNDPRGRCRAEHAASVGAAR